MKSGREQSVSRCEQAIHHSSRSFCSKLKLKFNSINFLSGLSLSVGDTPELVVSL